MTARILASRGVRPPRHRAVDNVAGVHTTNPFPDRPSFRTLEVSFRIVILDAVAAAPAAVEVRHDSPHSAAEDNDIPAVLPSEMVGIYAAVVDIHPSPGELNKGYPSAHIMRLMTTNDGLLTRIVASLRRWGAMWHLPSRCRHDFNGIRCS